MTNNCKFLNLGEKYLIMQHNVCHDSNIKNNKHILGNFAFRYANQDENSAAEGAVGYSRQPSPQNYENIYESISNDPNASNQDATTENIYETVDNLQRPAFDRPQEYPIYNRNDLPSCSTYGRIGNTYGRIDVLGHGIGRIERHLSSSCGSIDSNHYAMESLYGASDSTGRISKVSVQWLLVNKWLPLWIANTETGRDYRIIDFLLGQRGDYDNIPESRNNVGANEEPEPSHERQPPSPPPPPPT